jgi:glucodextranase-like protein
MSKIRSGAAAISLLMTFALAASAQAGAPGYAASAKVEVRPHLTITSPANGATVTSSPVTVTGTAGSSSGVKSVTVNGVGANLYGDNWTATVPLTVGQNTLTATMTPKYGSTESASVTVTYAPPHVTPPQITLVSKRFNGRAVLVKLACAPGTSNCTGKITVRYTETMVRHHKKRRITLVLASKLYALNHGYTATFSAALNRTGRRLLKAHGKLATKGTVTLTQANGHATTAASFKLTLKRPA